MGDGDRENWYPRAGGLRRESVSGLLLAKRLPTYLLWRVRNDYPKCTPGYAVEVHRRRAQLSEQSMASQRRKSQVNATPRDIGISNWVPVLFLVRHAESTGNQQACLQGSRIGGTLSELGRKQSLATATYLFDAFEELQHGNVRLVSSPSTRALQTASPIADRLRCEIERDSALSELDFGEWSGISVARLEGDRRYQLWKTDPWLNSPPGGETLVQVRSRTWQAVLRLVTIADAAHQPLVLITHFFPLMALFDILVPGSLLRCENASISRFELKDAGWRVSHINEISHLNAVAPTPVRYV